MQQNQRSRQARVLWIRSLLEAAHTQNHLEHVFTTSIDAPGHRLYLHDRWVSKLYVTQEFTTRVGGGNTVGAKTFGVATYQVPFTLKTISGALRPRTNRWAYEWVQETTITT